MKKILTIVGLCLTFIIIYFLELNFFSWFTIAGIKPNLFVILVLFIGLYSGRKMGTVFGAIFGFLIDIIRRKRRRNKYSSLGAYRFSWRISREKFIKRQ